MSPTESTEVSRNSCIEFTSPCRRDISRPTSVLSMKDSETRCRWREHRPAHVEEHVLGGLADHGLLDVAGGEVDQDRDGEGGARRRRARRGRPRPAAMPLSMAWRMISGIAELGAR